MVEDWRRGLGRAVSEWKTISSFVRDFCNVLCRSDPDDGGGGGEQSNYSRIRVPGRTEMVAGSHRSVRETKCRNSKRILSKKYLYLYWNRTKSTYKKVASNSPQTANIWRMLLQWLIRKCGALVLKIGKILDLIRVQEKLIWHLV